MMKKHIFSIISCKIKKYIYSESRNETNKILRIFTIMKINGVNLHETVHTEYKQTAVY